MYRLFKILLIICPFSLVGQVETNNATTVSEKVITQDGFQLKVSLLKSKNNLSWLKYTLTNLNKKPVYIDTVALYDSYFEDTTKLIGVNSVFATMEGSHDDGFRNLISVSKNMSFSKKIMLDNYNIKSFTVEFMWFTQPLLKKVKAIKIEEVDYKISNVFYVLYSKKVLVISEKYTPH